MARTPKARKPASEPKHGDADTPPPAWLRRLVTVEGERLPIHDLTTRSRRTQPVGRILAPATRRILGRKGLALATLMAHWPEVAGPALSRHCVPIKLAMPRKGNADSLGGVLHVKAASGAVATDLMHRAPLLCERLNATLGYRAVARLQVTQGPLRGSQTRRPARASALPPAPPSPARIAALDSQLAGIEDPDLRAALERLGRAVLASRR